MIQQQTMLNVGDNTGAKEIMCIRVMGGSYRCCAQAGDRRGGSNRRDAVDDVYVYRFASTTI